VGLTKSIRPSSSPHGGVRCQTYADQKSKGFQWFSILTSLKKQPSCKICDNNLHGSLEYDLAKYRNCLKPPSRVTTPPAAFYAWTWPYLYPACAVDQSSASPNTPRFHLQSPANSTLHVCAVTEHFRNSVSTNLAPVAQEFRPDFRVPLQGPRIDASAASHNTIINVHPNCDSDRPSRNAKRNPIPTAIASPIRANPNTADTTTPPPHRMTRRTVPD